jgi:Zn-dependent peptidase ImmA (M78 family)/transcriptional regulator with XRE-family HTH domain
MTHTTVRAPINGSTLRWAREALHLEPGELARPAKVSKERILAFESGDAEPTFNQLQKIAKKLDRTVAFFFTDAPSKPDVPETADYRGYSGEPIPYELARELRRAEQHRETVLQFDDDVPRPSLIKMVNQHNAATRAQELRQQLGLGDGFCPKAPPGNQLLNFWRNLLEQHGFLVFQTTGIDLKVFRGLSIYHDALPIILLNGADSHNGKVFTLFHEVAHLANRTSGVCVLDRDVGEEAIANAFAANFLMPEAYVRATASAASGTPLELAQEVANEFKVSDFAAAVRLRVLNFITDDDLDLIRAESDRRWQEQREKHKQGKGGPPHWRVRYRDLGSSYVGTIARALEDERVDLLDASYLLDAGIPTVQRMVDEYYRTEAPP